MCINKFFYLVLVYPVSLRYDLFDNVFIETISEFPEPELNFFPRPVVYKRKYKLFSSNLLWPTSMKGINQRSIGLLPLPT